MKLSILNIASYMIDFYNNVRNQKVQGLFNGQNEIEEEFLEDFETSRGLTNLRMQKLIYFLYGFYYSETKQELFNPDFLAYKMGPISKELHSYNSKIIKEKNQNGKYLFGTNDYPKFNYSQYKEQFDFELIDKILLSLKTLSTWHLVDLTHLPNSPWSETQQSKRINKNKIKKHFENLTLNYE